MGMGYGGFEDAESFQRALWWYYGSVGKAFARPPVVPVSPKDGFLWAVQQAVPVPADDRNGSAASETIGTVPMPTLFVCGINDPYLLCSLPYVAAQKNLVTSTYEVLDVPCAHDLMTCDGNATASTVVFETLTQFILAN